MRAVECEHAVEARQVAKGLSIKVTTALSSQGQVFQSSIVRHDRTDGTLRDLMTPADFKVVVA
jgi:hypothetical protein